MILLNNEPQNRCVILADYIITNRATVRKTAVYYGISKSTVHKDVTEKLQRINRGLYDEVKVILDFNKAERHIRGGEATKMKYMARKRGREGNGRF
jgi:sporulation transcriptional regulator SpoIIID